MKTRVINLTLLFLLCATSMSSAMEEASNGLLVSSDTPATQLAVSAGAGAGSETHTIKKERKRKRSSEKNKPYKCTFSRCGKSFIDKAHLTRHQRTHAGERPYKCTYAQCNESYADPRDLQRHLKAHTGKRRYTCTICGIGYKKQGALTQHISRVHNPNQTTPTPSLAAQAAEPAAHAPYAFLPAGPMPQFTPSPATLEDHSHSHSYQPLALPPAVEPSPAADLSGGFSLSMPNENGNTFNQDEFGNPLAEPPSEPPLTLPEPDFSSILFGASSNPEDGNL
ncbi:MAG: C2H2-type zinc finger protein [Candidatus Babeliales bacterium]